MKTNELTGLALDWAVAKAIGEYKPVSVPQYSTDWAHGGAIIERERITLIDQGGDYWQACCGWKEAFGDTPLIASMRCYVVSKLGDEVEIPDELTETAGGY